MFFKKQNLSRVKEAAPDCTGQHELHEEREEGPGTGLKMVMKFGKNTTNVISLHSMSEYMILT